MEAAGFMSEFGPGGFSTCQTFMHRRFKHTCFYYIFLKALIFLKEIKAYDITKAVYFKKKLVVSEAEGPKAPDALNCGFSVNLTGNH